MGETAIQWTDKVWNPVTGCSKVSAGCKFCYAERFAPRVFAGQTVDTGITEYRGGVAYPVTRPRRFTDVRCHPERLDQPLRWRKPRRVFVNSMSDLFHEDVPDEFIARVWAVMATAEQHTFQILTKRPERARELLTEWVEEQWKFGPYPEQRARTTPLPNVWVGVSVEDQAAADERVPLLLDTPAAVRFLSCEPLLGPVRVGHQLGRFGPGGVLGIDWLIVGGESGPKARPMDLAWARSLVEQGRAAGVPVFVKQLGAAPGERFDKRPAFADCLLRIPLRHSHGGDPDEWPWDLRVREFPS